MDKWNNLEEKFKHVTDRLGMPIDDGILETVVALNALGVLTSASCEGHTKHGLPYPWIDILRVELEKLLPEKETSEIKKLQIKLMKLQTKYYRAKKAYKTAEKTRNAKIVSEKKIFDLLAAFYEKRVVSYDRIIILSYDGRIQSQGGDFAELLPPEQRLQKLHEYQEEMQAFTDFLKSLYLTSTNEQ